MNKEKIKAIFEEKSVNGNSWMLHCYLTEIAITMKDGSEITMLYDDEVQYIDLTDDDYVGFGPLLINPYDNIQDIEIKWR